MTAQTPPLRTAEKAVVMFVLVDKVALKTKHLWCRAEEEVCRIVISGRTVMNDASETQSNLTRSNLDARVGAGSRQNRGVVVNPKCRHAIIRAQLVRLHSARRLAGEARVPPEEIAAFGTAYDLWPPLFLHVNLVIRWAEQFVSKMTHGTKRTTFGGLLSTVFVRVVPSHGARGLTFTTQLLWWS